MQWTKIASNEMRRPRKKKHQQTNNTHTKHRSKNESATKTKKIKEQDKTKTTNEQTKKSRQQFYYVQLWSIYVWHFQYGVFGQTASVQSMYGIKLEKSPQIGELRERRTER